MNCPEVKTLDDCSLRAGGKCPDDCPYIVWGVDCEYTAIAPCEICSVDWHTCQVLKGGKMNIVEFLSDPEEYRHGWVVDVWASEEPKSGDVIFGNVVLGSLRHYGTEDHYAIGFKENPLIGRGSILEVEEA